MLKNAMLMVFTTLVIIGGANAQVTGAHSLYSPPGFQIPALNLCPPNVNQQNVYPDPVTWQIKADGCNIYSNSYVPASGYYSVVTVLHYSTGQTTNYPTNPVYVDGSKSLSQQTVSATGGVTGYINVAKDVRVFLCYYLVDSNQKYYFLDGDANGVSVCMSGYTPLPPTPPIPNTNCTINDGSALSVSLGTLNRDEIPTVPDSASVISKTISVVCTGGTVTANMQLNYTPISVGSNQAVKTSANGVGAAIFYSNKVLAPSEVTSVNFLEGSNTVTLGFQAVRDSTVALKDIPTGAFTANAVLVMTQQ
ncbi:fimbrial protein [Lelliottia amnigena]|nr:fimbrial protein [Lelliottia amnigena]